MFTPIRVAAVTAVLALTGTMALISGPLAPTQPAMAPGAETPVSMEPAHYTGTVSAWKIGETEVTTLPDRTIEQWKTGFSNDVTDRRLNGTGRAMDYLESISGPDGSSFVTHSGVGRLVNDGGSFALECTGGGTMEAGGGIIACWYEGEDAYDGLTAFEVLTINASGDFDVEGWVFPADRPPLLEYEPE